MSGSDLQDLARRLAEATGPDRELDAAIWRALVNDHGAVEPDDEEGFVIGWHEHHEPGMTEWLTDPLPHYTADLNAAEALMRAVLPGAGWTVGSSAVLEMAEATVWSRRFISKKASAPTAPLAWLKAVVAAVMAREGEK